MSFNFLTKESNFTNVDGWMERWQGESTLKRSWHSNNKNVFFTKRYVTYVTPVQDTHTHTHTHTHKVT